MRIDVASEFFRPRELPVKKAKDAAEFFEASELGEAKKITVKVENEPDELKHGSGKVVLGSIYFNSYEAVNEEGKAIVRYKEEYDGTRLSTKDSEDHEKKEALEWACLAAARNRLKLADDGVRLTIISPVGIYTEDKFENLDRILKEKKPRILYVSRK